MSKWHDSFLVSCAGAYDDSGMGTGGFVCVHHGEAIIVDSVDCSGLFVRAETCYRLIRSRQSVIGYDKDGIKSIVNLKEIKDGHDIMVTESGYIGVATGKNEVCWYDAFGNLTRKWKADGKDDAWHLNCLEVANGQLHISAFGEFKEHRGWNGRSQQTGFILNMESGKKVVEGLSGPHNPRFMDGQWAVCESHINAVTIVESQTRSRKIQLDGFTRGFACDENFFYIGESANRKAALVKDYSHIAIIDRKTEKVAGRIRIPFPEIYEVAIISSELADAIASNTQKFQLDTQSERIAALESQVRRGFEEAGTLRLKLDKIQSQFFYRLWNKISGAKNR